MIKGDTFGAVRELVKAKKINEAYISGDCRWRCRRLTVLEAILVGQQPEGMPRLMEGVAVEWGDRQPSVPATVTIG